MGEEDTKLIGLSDELRAGVSLTWGKVVNHSSVTELGDNTLSRKIFYPYFNQDYLSLKDWSVLLNLATPNGGFGYRDGIRPLPNA